MDASQPSTLTIYGNCEQPLTFRVAGMRVTVSEGSYRIDLPAPSKLTASLSSCGHQSQASLRAPL